MQTKIARELLENSDVEFTPSAHVLTRNLGEITHSLLPINDIGLHLLDGSVLSGEETYGDFVRYVRSLISTVPTLFTTEENWQSSVTTYGVCGKFVYDSTNNTVRLPKVTGFIEGTIVESAIGDLVEAGLPNITGGTGYGSWWFATVSQRGALEIYQTSNNVGSSGTGGGWGASEVRLDASKSNPIYKDNFNKVQPQSIKGYIYMVVANSVDSKLDELENDINLLKQLCNLIVPAGSIIWSANATVPTGYLLCNGSAVSRETYSNLFVAIGTTYGEGDGNTTFNLPNLIGKFVEGASTAGVEHAAGLPNISGNTWEVIYRNTGVSGNGVFTITDYGTYWDSNAGSSYQGHRCNINFDASKANSIYGASTTVQPPSVTALPCIKY